MHVCSFIKAPSCFAIAVLNRSLLSPHLVSFAACNVISQSPEGSYTMVSPQQHRNCSFSIIYPVEIDISEFSLGHFNNFPKVNRCMQTLRHCLGALDSCPHRVLSNSQVLIEAENNTTAASFQKQSFNYTLVHTFDKKVVS